MATETQSPDAVLDSTNYSSATLGDIQDDPDSPDANWWTWDGNGNTVCRVSFPTPTGDPTQGADLQEFRVQIRKSASGGAQVDWSLQLYEGGIIVGSALATGTTTSTSGEVISGKWNAADLTNADGSQVEVRIQQTAGGTGGGRKGLEVGAVEWNVDYQTGQTYNETGSGTASSGGTALPVEHVKEEDGSGTAASGGTADPPELVITIAAVPDVDQTTLGGSATVEQVHGPAVSGGAVTGGAGDSIWTSTNQGSGTAASGGTALPVELVITIAAVPDVDQTTLGGAATDSLSYNETGSGTASSGGTALPVEHVKLETASGGAVSGGAGDSIWTSTNQGSGTAPTGGTGDPPELVITLAGSGTAVTGGAATDEHVEGGTTYNETGSGTAWLGGSSYPDAPVTARTRRPNRSPRWTKWTR